MLWHVLIYCAEDSHFSCDLTAAFGKPEAAFLPMEQARSCLLFSLEMA